MIVVKGITCRCKASHQRPRPSVGIKKNRRPARRRIIIGDDERDIHIILCQDCDSVCSHSHFFFLSSSATRNLTLVTMMEIDDDEMQGMGFQVSRRQAQQQQQPSKIRGSTGGNSHAHAHSLVVPGQTITSEQGFLRGHGTYFEQQGQQQGQGGQQSVSGKEEEHLVSSLAGVIERVNKLVSVHPPSSRYAVSMSISLSASVSVFVTCSLVITLFSAHTHVCMHVCMYN